MSNALNLSDMLLDLRDLIAKRMGIYFREQDLAQLEATLDKRTKPLGMANLAQYFTFLQSSSPACQAEWDHLIRLLTTGESYFFRDLGQFDLLRQELIPGIIKRKGKEKSLTIWSAGCSTGEEPYSLAILLTQLLPDYKQWQINILGTDLNQEVISKAQKGRYGKWSFRKSSSEEINLHFEAKGLEWEIKPQYRAMVQLRQGNLIQDELNQMGIPRNSCDLILCRNVFIYFQESTIRKVMDKFQAALATGGLLITGHAEVGEQHPAGLVRKLYPQSVIFEKVTPGFVSEITPPPLAKPAPLVAKPRPVLAKPQPTPRPQAAATPRATPQKQQVNPRDQLLLEARQAADQGNYNLAGEKLEQAVGMDEFYGLSYLYLGQLLEMTQGLDKAKEAYQKALYLDPNLPGAYLELAGIFASTNQLSKAKKMKENAMQLLQSLNPSLEVPPYQGLTAGELLLQLKQDEA